MVWSGQQRGFTVHAFIESGRSVTTTQRAFRACYSLGPSAPVPDRKTIISWVAKFLTTGSTLRKKAPGRPRTKRTPDAIEAVQRAIEQSPSRSARKHATCLGHSNRGLRRILHLDLRLHPYKSMMCQELSDADFAKRKVLCAGIIEQVPRSAGVMCTDEAHFHLHGTVNKQNSRYWSNRNPKRLHQRPLHSPYVTVWCGFVGEGIIGPYFFEEDGDRVSVNADRYIHMLETFLRPIVEESGLRNLWFQQDGATAHTARRTIAVLRELFPGRLISRSGDIDWPARSPDLNPCDFFLWGYLKDRVYRHRPRSIEQLKQRIIEEVEAIPTNMTMRVEENFWSRLQLCVRNNGHHLSDLIFKT